MTCASEGERAEESVTDDFRMCSPICAFARGPLDLTCVQLQGRTTPQQLLTTINHLIPTLRFLSVEG